MRFFFLFYAFSELLFCKHIVVFQLELYKKDVPFYSGNHHSRFILRSFIRRVLQYYENVFEHTVDNNHCESTEKIDLFKVVEVKNY